MSNKQHISGILTQYIGKRDETLADLDVYLRTPVGVGEHPNIGQEIRTKIEELDKLDSLIETMKQYFGNDNITKEDSNQEVQ